MIVWRCSVLCLSALCLLGSSSRLAVDVGIPPGSPILWGQRIPMIAPRGVPLFPAPPAPAAEAEREGATKAAGKGGPRTVVQGSRNKAGVGAASPSGMLRILTWNLTSRLPWVMRKKPDRRGAVGAGPSLPTPDDTFYWACMTPLLRLMLHPQLVSKNEVIAHLVEIGEPVKPALRNAKAVASLTKTCLEIDKMISASRRSGPPKPLLGKTARETMLRRFVAEELVRDFPYDPNGTFGERLFLLGEEIEASLVDYAGHEDSLLRRNAVAALCRLGTDSSLYALNSIAVATKDPVVLMRCLAALGRHRFMPNPKPLLRRAQSASNSVEKIALVVALGQCGRPEAVPFLSRLAGNRKSRDLQLAALTALAWIGFAPDDGSLNRLAKRVSNLSRKSPLVFALRATKSEYEASAPDDSMMRAATVEQIALLLRVRIDPKDTVAVDRLLAFCQKDGESEAKSKLKSRSGKRGDSGKPVVRSHPRFPNTAMGTVMPAAQFLFIETLPRLGKRGVAIAKEIALGWTTEPVLRAHAMAQLPLDECWATAENVVGDSLEGLEACACAFDVLVRAGSEQIPKICNSLLRRCARTAPRDATSEERHAWRQALLALGARNGLDIKRLKPLLLYVHARKKIHHDNASIALVEVLVGDLVQKAGARKKDKGRRGKINAVLDVVIQQGLRPYHTEKRRPGAVVYVERQLDGIRLQREDPNYRARVNRSILGYLLGNARPDGVQDRVIPRPLIQLEEEILFAFGRLRSKAGAEVLTRFIAENPDSVLRAHACLALGMSGQKSVASKLVPSLIHADGFVRYCAYRSLRQLTGQDFWANWMYGERKGWFAIGEYYLRWLGRR